MEGGWVVDWIWCRCERLVLVFMFSLMNDTRNCIKSFTHQVFFSTAVRILYYPRRILCILVSQNEQILRHERPNRTIKQHLQYTTPTTQATTTTTRTKRAVTVRVRPHLLDAKRPVRTRGVRQWPNQKSRAQKQHHRTFITLSCNREKVAISAVWRCRDAK